MEKQLYYEYPYVKEFDAKVLSCEEWKDAFAVVLDQTAFYPEGGGQPADGGTLDGQEVLDVQERGDRILHKVKEPIAAGKTVHGVIDWDKRFSLTQEHSGEHIVSGLIHRKYGYNNVGYHMGEEIRLDLDGVLTWDELMEIEREANEIVFADIPLHIWYPSAEELRSIDYRSKKELTGTVRLVEIPGADICACCGTHVERTGEIGPIKFMSMIHYKGGVRIMMLCGRKAMAAFDEKLDSTREICELLSAKPGESAMTVRKFYEQDKEKDMRIAALTRELFRLRADTFTDGSPLLIDFEEGFSPLDLRRCCDFLMKAGKGDVVACLTPAVLSGGRAKDAPAEPASYSYCIGSSAVDVRAKAKMLNGALNGRGGGSPQMIQGSFSAGPEEIRETLERIFGGKE